MGQQDSFFEALGGETPIGFFTHSTSIGVGADVTGNQVGVKGICGGPDPGDGVQGFGSGDFSGVAGFGGNVPVGQAGTGVIGLGGVESASLFGGGGPGVRGIGGGAPNTSPANAVGVFGQGGKQSPGVVGQGGLNPADGVQGFGTGHFSGVAGFGDKGGTNEADGTGVFGQGGGASGQGVRGIGAGGPNTSPASAVGVYGQAGSGSDGVQGVGSGTQGAGVHGISSDLNGNGMIAEANNGARAFAIWARSSSGFAGFFDGNVQVNGDFLVTGAKSAVVAFPDGSSRRLYCMESPESWFEDFGVGQLVNGCAEVELAIDFASVVTCDSYHVFLTEYDDNSGLYVTNRTSTSFAVRARSSKTSNGSFSYRVVAKRKDIAGRRLEPVTIPTEKVRSVKTASPAIPLPPSERTRISVRP
jgi:hypothetical protein